jgi:mannitol/fructose-specific phosphotransferase system IIA component (Ntr-type)
MIACSSNETEIELSKSKIAAPTVNGKRLVKIKHGETYTSIEYNSQGQVSKVKHHFGHRVEIEAYGKNDVTPYMMAKQDFLISSIDFPGEDYEGDIIYVNPLLPDKDMKILDDKVSYYEKLPERNSVEDIFTKQLDQVHYMALQIKTVLKELKVMKVDNYISFDEFLVAVSEKISPYSDRQYMIQEDIRKRERLGSQVFSSMGFSLFHARTSGVVKPAFMVCLTKNKGVFYDSYFQGIDVCLVMLVPDDEHAEENGKILGCLSSMLIEEDEFLYTLKNGDIEEIRNLMSGYLKKFFDDYLIRM